MAKNQKIIRIEAKPPTGVHRAGMFHPAEPKDYPRSKFSKDQIAALKAEKKLIVTEYEGELPKEAMTESEKVEAEKNELISRIADLENRIANLETQNKKLASKAKTDADTKNNKTDSDQAGK